MTNPYAVPVEELDAVRVPEELQVADEPLRWATGGGGATGDVPDGGGGPDADGD